MNSRRGLKLLKLVKDVNYKPGMSIGCRQIGFYTFKKRISDI